MLSKGFMPTKPFFFLTFMLPWFFAFAEPDSAEIFGEKFPKLDGMSTGEWWEKAKPVDASAKKKGKAPKQIIDLNVPRDQVVAFALYTVDSGTLKLTGQLYPLLPMNPAKSDWKPSRESNGRRSPKSKSPILAGPPIFA